MLSPLSSLESALNLCWYGHGAASWLTRALIFPLFFPLSLIYRFAVWSRRLAYRRGWLESVRLPVPVIVVGNITVGGTGKTPLTLALVDALRDAGYRPGILSRGYGSTPVAARHASLGHAGSDMTASPVSPDSDPHRVGDEPVLLARRSGCPVWVARARAEAGRQLLAFHPEVNVLLTDDGLQHYALKRDMEIVVVDVTRGWGTECMLPAGPLREPVSRLSGVTAVVANGGALATATASSLGVLSPAFVMQLQATVFCNLADPDQVLTVADMLARVQGLTVHAMAGIGHPQRFFDGLRALGMAIAEHPFPDHYAYRQEDLPAGWVCMTEKDAMKCIPLVLQAGRSDCWFLRVDAVLEPGLIECVINQLNQG